MMQLNETFGALRDPTRREILQRLRAGPATVLQLAEPFEVSLNAVSKHIKVLERAGLVTRKVVGREHYCTLNAGPLAQASSWIETYRVFWTSALDGLSEYVSNKDPQ